MRKFPKLPIVISVTLGLGFIASAILNVQQYNHAQQDKKLLQGQITDLTYQVNQDKASPSPSATPDVDAEPSSTPTSTPTASPSESPAVAGAKSVNVSQLEIKLTASDPVSDLTYGMARSGAYDVAALTTETLVAKYAACKPSDTNNALGLIVRKKPGVSSTGTFIKKLGDWNYYYLEPKSGTCATDQAGRNNLAAARAAVKNTVIPSMSQ